MSQVLDYCTEHKDTIVTYIWQDVCPLCAALNDLENCQMDLEKVSETFDEANDNVASLLDKLAEKKEDIERLNNQISELEDELARA